MYNPFTGTKLVIFSWVDTYLTFCEVSSKYICEFWKYDEKDIEIY